MRYSKCNILFFSFMVCSLVATSFAGVFATTGLAASGQVTQVLINGSVVYRANNSWGGLFSSSRPTASPTTFYLRNGSSLVSVPKSPTTVPTPVQSGSVTTDEQRAFALLNGDRASHGLPALKLNLQLSALAGSYAQDMINRSFFAHNNPEGQSPFDRMRAVGITYRYAGENIAINRSVDSAEAAFMNSPGHRANILSPNYTEVGLGVRYDKNGSVYVAQEFISR